MGFLSSAIAERKMTSYDLWREIYGRRQSKTGKVVNVDTAVQVSAVFACLRVIGNGRAQVPLKLMHEEGRNRLPAKKHPLYRLMTAKPNRWQTAFQWRQMMSWHVELTGDHYSFINRIGKKIVELYPFTPEQVEPKEIGQGLFEYKVTFRDGVTQTFQPNDILHVRGPSWNGWQGLNVLHAAREAVGLSLASEDSAASLHKNGIRISGVYSVEGKLDETQHKGLMAQILKHNGGPDNDGKPLILDRAAKWMSTQMTGVDAQALETRKYQIEEVCRFFGVMPIMAGYSDKTATFASAEAMFQAHIDNCLAPRWASDEQIFDAALLTDAEREEGYYFDYVEEAMKRGSIKDTKDVLLGYTNGGLMTPNEARAKLDLNPDADPASDKLRIPANIVGEVTPAEAPTL